MPDEFSRGVIPDLHNIKNAVRNGADRLWACTPQNGEWIQERHVEVLGKHPSKNTHVI